MCYKFNEQVFDKIKMTVISNDKYESSCMSKVSKFVTDTFSPDAPCAACGLWFVYWKRPDVKSVNQYLLVFFFSFAYTTSPAVVMKLAVFFRSSKTPYNFWWSGVAEGHCAIRSCWCLLHIWRTCSVVWSSSPQGHVGEGTIFSSLCMCAFSLLWPERSRAKTTWPGLPRMWYASFSCLGFSAVLYMHWNGYSRYSLVYYRTEQKFIRHKAYKQCMVIINKHKRNVTWNSEKF